MHHRDYKSIYQTLEKGQEKDKQSCIKPFYITQGFVGNHGVYSTGFKIFGEKTMFWMVADVRNVAFLGQLSV